MIPRALDIGWGGFVYRPWYFWRLPRGLWNIGDMTNRSGQGDGEGSWREEIAWRVVRRGEGWSEFAEERRGWTEARVEEGIGASCFSSFLYRVSKTSSQHFKSLLQFVYYCYKPDTIVQDKARRRSALFEIISHLANVRPKRGDSRCLFCVYFA